jgi:DNA (cytosine-5)-methyltransferase 1
MASKVPVIGLFSGAGGLELGATAAGADVRLSVDNDRLACETLRFNRQFHASEVLEADVSKLDGKTLRKRAGLSPGRPCLVIGGPPCQPFSKSSYWTDPGDDSRFRRARARGEVAPKPAPITEARPDVRRTLVQEFLRLIVEVVAEGFLFENVVSITHPRNKGVLEAFIADAQAAGYETFFLRVNALDYGVPQRRQRVVVLGLKGGKPDAPPPTHSEAESGDLFTLPVRTAGPTLEPFADDRFAEPEEVVKGRYAKELREISPGAELQSAVRLGGPPEPRVRGRNPFLDVPAEAQPRPVFLDHPGEPWPVGRRLPLVLAPPANRRACRQSMRSRPVEDPSAL